MGGHREPNVLSIAPGAPYLPTLVEALLCGELVEGFAPKDDPLALASTTIWVPTRRAARSLATEFCARLGNSTTLLPAIHALGDANDESLLLEQPETIYDLEATLPSLDRHLILSRLVMQWADSLNPKQRALLGGQDIIMPSSVADAVQFAADLARLMDTVATEEVSWSKLAELVPDDHAQWWQLTLQFLKIATDLWPALLDERGLKDAATLRAARLQSQADLYSGGKSNGPVIAAGSTGSIPATAQLLKAISRMENGAVVLPGLDRDLDPETWAKIDLPDNDRDDSGTSPAHPQYGLKKLLHHLEIDRDTVRHIGGINNSSAGIARVREKLVSEAMRPSFSTARWQAVFTDFTADQRARAFNNVTLIEPPGEREEALAIALALRQALENPAHTAALVTPDRNLARRVAVEMRRFGLEVDDSAGQPLRNKPAGTFARLVMQAGGGEADPLVLISLIKHPLARFGASAERTRGAARVLELTILRGALSPPRFGTLRAAIEAAHNRLGDPGRRSHTAVRRLSDADWNDGIWLADRLDQVFGSHKEDGQEQSFFHEHALRGAQLLEACGVDEAGSLTGLYGQEDGKALYSLMGDLIDQREAVRCGFQEWPAVFDCFLGQIVVRATGGTHPRVSILGPLEARLQTFDRVVLGGLNEKSWPAAARNDPFLSRPMKATFKLPLPERRTGLAAHDFQMLLGMGDVVLTRSLRADNAPAVASRWVQRLLTLAGDQATRAMQDRGQRILDWVSEIDKPERLGVACPQPRPSPPVALRPMSLSITDIETWISDPYAIYAKRILKLDALDELIRQPDAREKGTLFHGIFEKFIMDPASQDEETDFRCLLAIGKQEFDQSVLPDDVTALWWARFEDIARHFIDWHRTVLPELDTVYPELSGATDADLDGFTLRGRADRIDRLISGGIAVRDYKTGTSPTIAAVKKMDAPQLPLEAAMAVRGAFGDHVRADARDLTYVRLRPNGEFTTDHVGHEKRSAKDPSAEQLAEEAWTRLTALVRSYRNPDQAYVSKARFISDREWPSDYDHLARVREWSTADDGEDP